MTQHLQTHPKKIHHLSLIEEIDDKDVLLAIQEMRRRTCRLPRNTPHTHAVLPDKISRLERVAPIEVEKSKGISVQKEELASTCSTAPSSLDPSEHPQESERSSVPSGFSGKHWVIQNATDRSSCTGSCSKVANSCHPTRPKNQKNAQINHEQPANSHSRDSDEAKGSSESQEDKKIRPVELSLQRKTRRSAAAHIDASHGSTPDVVPIKEQINELTATLLDLAETYLDEKMNIKFHDDSTLGSTWDEDSLTLTLNEPARCSGSTRTSSASIGEKVAFPPAISTFLGIVACQDNDIYRYDDSDDDLNFLSLLANDGSVPTEDFIMLGKPPLKASRGPQVMRSASPLFVKQDREEGPPVGTSMSQPKGKGFAFDLTKFDEQGDADCDALAGGARSERPVVGNSVSQIKGKTTEQSNAVDADANSLQSTKKAKAWKFDLTEFSLTSDEQNADADCQALLGDVRSEGPVQKKPIQATPTLQGADQPDDQLESEGTEVMSSICDSKSLKKKGWKLRWGRREK